MDRTEEPHPGSGKSVLRTEAATEAIVSKKGKSRMRARTDILRSNAANARRKAKAKSYDRARYDGNEGEEVA
jgi:hypothetical protein